MKRVCTILSVSLTLAIAGMDSTTNPIDRNSWRLISFGHTRMAVPPGIVLRFTDGSYEGFAGCNGISGEYHLESDSLKLTQNPSTQLACRYISTETKFRKLLSETDSYEVKNERLEMKSGGRPILIFAKDNDISTSDTNRTADR